MIPQDSFVIVAKVEPGCVAALRQLLATMTLAAEPGMADPDNALVPFGNYEISTSPGSSCSRTTRLKDRVAFRSARVRSADLPLLHGGLRRRGGRIAGDAWRRGSPG